MEGYKSFILLLLLYFFSLPCQVVHFSIICLNFYFSDTFIRVIAEWRDEDLKGEFNHSEIRIKMSEPSSPHQYIYGTIGLVPSQGVTIISDIDDTIKDSDVHLGARAAMKNAFLQDSREVPGMADVYCYFYVKGVAFHYVSASPYQLLPTIIKFLQTTKFPPGSVHLRSYDLTDSGESSKPWQNPGSFKYEKITDILMVGYLVLDLNCLDNNNYRIIRLCTTLYLLITQIPFFL